jgi:hypothetical protein
LRQKYGIIEGNPAFKYNTRKILMLMELGEFIFSYGPTKISLWISYNSFNLGPFQKVGLGGG